ncbi:substrate-binding periplasmic protein [Zooshikella sp. RANM57]|uniref:substrate-binding periplasmic protein n=1 Tax=Zooshikella sp. RANM57 TaxID=3425863 RepID=UPI003D6F5225
MKSTYLIILFIFSAIVFRPSLASEQPLLIFATEPWPPYFGPSLLRQGYMVDVLQSVLNSAGYQVRIDYIGWKRALAQAKKGKYTGIIGLYYTEDREAHFRFSPPLAKSTVCLYQRYSKRNQLMLDDISQYRLGVVTNDTLAKGILDSRGLVATVDASQTVIVDALLSGNLDALVATAEVFEYSLKSHSDQQYRNIQTMSPVLSTHDLFIGFSKTWPGIDHVVSKFEEHYLKLQEQGVIKAIQVLHNIDKQYDVKGRE